MRFPPEIDLRLEGWKLDWFDVEWLEGEGNMLSDMWFSFHENIRERYAS